MTIPPNRPYNPYPYPRRRPAEAGALVAVPPDRETQLKRDLKALEAVQASRPRKPPGKGRAA